MGSFVLTCCSTVDMKKEFFEQRQIPYVCFHYTMDGVTYPDDLGQSIPFPEFYSRIAKGATPVTSQVNVEEYCDFFERTIVIVDSLGASAGYGLLLDAVADLRDKGVSLEEAREWTEDNKLFVHHWFFSTDLTSFKRGGRISATSAMLGTVLNICPLMNIDETGHLIPRQKIRTKKKAIQEIINTMEAHAKGGRDYSGKCFLSYSACEDDAREVAALVEERFPNLSGKVMLNSIGAVIGSHTGPGTVALFFWGNKRTD